MAADRIDGWAKALAGGVSRRRVLRGMGRVLAGALALGGAASAAAATDCTDRCTRLPAGVARDQCQAACTAAGQARATAETEADQARATAAALRACHGADAACDGDDQCCPGLVCGADGSCQAPVGGGDGECPPGAKGACQTAAGTTGRCCNGSCCPSPCECRISFNGTFCYSGRRATECEYTPRCDVAGVRCECIDANCSCYEIPCHNNPGICPAGSQCTANTICEELCRTP